MADWPGPSGTRVLFMGSPEFAVPSLKALVEAGYNVVGVVTQPDRPAGRGGRLTSPPVKLAAAGLGLPVHQPGELRSDAAYDDLAAFVPDLVVVAAYGRILSRRVLELPPHGAVNVHASLLPRWRGASPINAAILAGDDITGVSIMEMVRKMDAGPVIATRELPIEPGDTTGTLEPRLAQLGAEMLVEALPGWLAGETVAQPQDEEAATYCSLIKKQDGQLAGTMTAAEAERAVRAYNPWPGAFLNYRGQRLSIWRAHVSSKVDDAETGTMTVHEKRPAIHFHDALLVLDEVQRMGAKRVDGAAFLNGERGDLAPSVELA